MYKTGIDISNYTTKYYDTITLLLKQFLTKEGFEDVEYWIYDYKKGYLFDYLFEDEKIEITTFDDFYLYLQRNYRFKNNCLKD